MNTVQKILMKMKKRKAYNELCGDLHFLLEYLSLHSAPTYAEITEFYTHWENFGKKYIQTPEKSKLYDILEVLNKAECKLIISYMVMILNKWLEVVINYDKQLTVIVDKLSTTKSQIEIKQKTRTYALNTIELQQSMTKSFQKLLELFEKYAATKE